VKRRLDVLIDHLLLTEERLGRQYMELNLVGSHVLRLHHTLADPIEAIASMEVETANQLSSARMQSPLSSKL
jgi:hypothetical protein